MATIPVFAEEHLRAVCQVLGATDTGLTNSEIDEVLHACRIDDPHPRGRGDVVVMVPKRERLLEALRRRQERDRCGNNVIAFVKASMAPVRYAGNPSRFRDLRERLNTVLSFVGYELGEDGEVCKVTSARTLGEAEERAGHLRAELERRGVHPDVLRFCRAELLEANYFHAVLEATKSLADKIRQRTGLQADGVKLAEEAFGFTRGGLPRLAFNSLQTPTEVSEHVGLWNLVRGIFGAFRNVSAHAPKIYWPIREQDALDLLTLASLIHRRLDDAVSPAAAPTRTGA